MKEKLILVDADGVLLNWEYAFQTWLEHHGHESVVMDKGLCNRIEDQYGLQDQKGLHLVKIFNESAAIGFLPALRDSVQYVKTLANEGYRFHVITSVSDDESVGRLRAMNLQKLFGDIFDHIECLPIGSSKEEYLSKFENSGLYWIEDNVRNAEDGLKLGLQPLLVEHGFNMNYKNSQIPLVKDWKEIYELVTSRCTFLKQINDTTRSDS